MKYFLLFIFIFIFFIPNCHAIYINEVHPRSPEWVEIYNPDSTYLNLSEWFIKDNSSQVDKITCYIIENCSLETNANYFLIIGRNTNISSITNQTITYFYVDDQMIGNGLNDNGDFISFYNSSYSTNMTYYRSFDGSWAWNGTEWIECYEPSPGQMNNCTKEENQTVKGDLKLNISLNGSFFRINESIGVNGYLTNSFGITLNGTISIKFKENSMKDYPENWTVINQNVSVSNGSYDLESLIGGKIFWIVPENAISGNYKCYVRFDLDEKSKNETNRSFTSGSAYFDVYGIGNIFINSWYSPFSNLSLNETANITINISNQENEIYNISVYFIIEDLKTVSESKHNEVVFCGSIEMGNTSTEVFCNWTVPEDAISSNVKMYPKIGFMYNNFTIEKTGEKREIIINGLEYIGEPFFEIISNSERIRFGDFGLTIIKFYSGSYDFQSLKFVTYGYNPGWVTQTLSGNTLRTKPCEQDTAVEIKNLTRDSSIYVALPFFVKANCDNEYQEGIYNFYTKVCRKSDDGVKEIYDKKYNVSIQGRNDIFCQKNVIVKNESVENKSENNLPFYNIISSPSAVRPDDEFEIVVLLTNNFNETKNFSIYSYIYADKNLVSSGWDGKVWKNTWDANKKIVIIIPNSSFIVTLKNMIKNGTEPGIYKLNVRVNVDNKKYDLTKNITVLPYEPVPYLNVSRNESVFRVFTNCEECKLLIFTPDGFFENKSYFVFESNNPGYYYFLLTKDSKIIQKVVMNVSAHEKESLYTSNNVSIPTGSFIVSEKRSLLDNIFSFFSQIFNSIYKTIKNWFP